MLGGAPREGTDGIRGTLLHGLGVVLLECGRFTEARDALTAGFALIARFGYEAAPPTFLVSTAILHHEQGLAPAARRCLDEATAGASRGRRVGTGVLGDVSMV
ncbi:MAG: hypothetical protein U0166_16750 [Acidobacteriota bacterium]